MNCVIRMLESVKSSEYTVKQISYIFGMDASDVDRRFRRAKGMTLKAYLDEVLKDRLYKCLRKGFKYGYQCANLLGFSSDYAFYHWFKRVHGKSFRQLWPELKAKHRSELRAGGM